jgi:hypothetical protein
MEVMQSPPFFISHKPMRNFHWLSYFLYFFFFSFYEYGHADLGQETVFLTWQKDPTTTMTIQWLSFLAQKETTVFYRAKQSDSEWKEISAEFFAFPHSSQYLFHRVEITQLCPDTDYFFSISPYVETYEFHTLPNQLNSEIRFVVGGDMYHDEKELMNQTSQEAARTRPHFALLGGDIAYAVGSSRLPVQRVDKWVEWIKNWHQIMRTPQGQLIPVVAAVGNHDVVGQFDQTPKEAAIFSTLFPLSGKQIYTTFDVGSYLTILLLDSGHANPIAGKQAAWINQALQVRQNMLHRFAIYHIPAYPSNSSVHNRYSKAIREYWVPLFEKGNIQAVFEHHDHTYKRTYPLLNHHIDPKGITYLGDGAWGVKKLRKPKSRFKRAYLAKTSSSRHFILIRLTPKEQTFTSISGEGKIIDEYTHILSIN